MPFSERKRHGKLTNSAQSRARALFMGPFAPRVTPFASFASHSVFRMHFSPFVRVFIFPCALLVAKVSKTSDRPSKGNGQVLWKAVI